MDDHGDFDSVSWRNENEGSAARRVTAEPFHETTLPSRISNGKRRLSSHHQHRESQPQAQGQAGELADPIDLGGIGDGVLECSVDSPLKENDGTKDAYVSYLVTTTVGLPPRQTAACYLLYPYRALIVDYYC
jgi:sorting nexin-4